MNRKCKSRTFFASQRGASSVLLSVSDFSVLSNPTGAHIHCLGLCDWNIRLKGYA